LLTFPFREENLLPPSMAKTHRGVDFWKQHRNHVLLASHLVVSAMVLVIPPVKDEIISA